MSKTQQVFFVIFAILSIPSAYMYGLSVPIGKGMSSLLDTTFYSGEIFRFGLFLAFFSAAGRPLYLVIRGMIWTVAVAEDGGRSNKKLLIGAKLFVALVVLASSLLLLSRFMDYRLLPSFAVTLLLIFLFYGVMFALISQIMAGPASNRQEEPLPFLRLIGKFFRLSRNWKSYWSNPLLLFLNFSLILIIIAYFGIYRMVTIVTGYRYCIMTDMGVIQAAIIGRTDDGIVVATSRRDFLGLYEAIKVPSSIHFINKDRILDVHWDCESHFGVPSVTQSEILESKAIQHE